MRKKKKLTNKSIFIIGLIVFLVISFEFFIRNDNLFGGLMVLASILNLFAYTQSPKRVGSVTVSLVFVNSILSLTTCYNYIEINYSILAIAWLIIGIVFLVVASTQYLSILSYNKAKKRYKRKMQ